MNKAACFLAIVATAVGACKTTTTTTTTEKRFNTVVSPKVAAARQFASEQGDVGTAIAAGKTLTARPFLTVGQVRNPVTGKVTPLKPSTVTLRQNDKGAHDVALSGEVFHFEPGDRRVYSDGKAKAYRQANHPSGYVRIGTSTGTVDEWSKAGAGWHEVLYSSRFDAKDVNTRGFYVLGTETKDSEMSGLGKVTYTGEAAMNKTYTTGYESYRKNNVFVKGYVTLTADFTKGEMSGKATHLAARYPGSNGYVSVQNEWIFEPTRFKGNGYTGKMTVISTVTNAPVAGDVSTYSGAFFGPKAQETAGVMHSTYTPTKGPKVDGYGYFTAKSTTAEK